MAQKVRIFIACSLDGFIAGPDDDLTWLDALGEGGPGETDHGFEQLMREVGCLLMGRNSYRVVEGFDGAWPYGKTPVLVATTRALTPKVPEVRAVRGTIESLVDQAKEVAGAKDVYIDGGNLIRQALDAGLVDLMCVTLFPVLLGSGSPLFAGIEKRRFLRLEEQRSLGHGVLQLTYDV